MINKNNDSNEELQIGILKIVFPSPNRKQIWYLCYQFVTIRYLRLLALSWHMVKLHFFSKHCTARKKKATEERAHCLVNLNLNCIVQVFQLDHTLNRPDSAMLRIPSKHWKPWEISTLPPPPPPTAHLSAIALSLLQRLGGVAEERDCKGSYIGMRVEWTEKRGIGTVGSKWNCTRWGEEARRTRKTTTTRPWNRVDVFIKLLAQLINFTKRIWDEGKWSYCWFNSFIIKIKII